MVLVKDIFEKHAVQQQTERWAICFMYEILVQGSLQPICPHHRAATMEHVLFRIIMIA